MKPHIEEAWRALRLADRDIKVFDILMEEPEAHLSIVLFHAQQAVEKSLKKEMARTTIDRPIINSPYTEPSRHWRYERGAPFRWSKAAALRATWSPRRVPKPSTIRAYLSRFHVRQIVTLFNLLSCAERSQCSKQFIFGESPGLVTTLTMSH